MDEQEGGGSGVDNALEQKKLKTKKSSKTAQNPSHPVHTVLGCFAILERFYFSLQNKVWPHSDILGES